MKLVNLVKPSSIILMLIVLSQFTIGCYANRPILPAKASHSFDQSEITAFVIPGGKYKIKLLDGREAAINVTRLDDENIYGVLQLVNNGQDFKAAEGTIRRDNILSVKQWRISPVATAIAIGISVGFMVYAITLNIAGVGSN